MDLWNCNVSSKFGQLKREMVYNELQETNQCNRLYVSNGANYLQDTRQSQLAPYPFNSAISQLFPETSISHLKQANMSAWQQLNSMSSPPPGFGSFVRSHSPEEISSGSDSSETFSGVSQATSFNAHLCKPFYDTTNSATQTNYSATDEKFSLCESILTGCEELKKMSHLIPSVPNFEVYMDSVRDNVLLSLSRNTCSQLAPGATERTIIADYAKTLIRISDTWLAARSCFGVTERCSGLCNLHTTDLSRTYAEWMQATTRLLNSMVRGLHKTNMMYMTDLYFREEDIAAPPAATSAYQTYPYKAASTEILQPPLHNNSPRKYAGQSCSMLPIPPQAFVNIPPSTSGEYMKPSSYNVPRKELSQSRKKININIAKNAIVGGAAHAGAYVIPLSAPPQQDWNNDDQLESCVSKEKVYQIAIRKKDGMTNNQNERKVQLLEKPAQRRALTQFQTAQIQEIIRVLFKFDLPPMLKYLFKQKDSEKTPEVKYPVVLETIGTKFKSSAYETIEQFIYDCRRLFLNAPLYYQSDEEEMKKVTKFNAEFERVLQEHFHDSYKWDHITGEFQEGKNCSELKYSSIITQ